MAYIIYIYIYMVTPFYLIFFSGMYFGVLSDILSGMCSGPCVPSLIWSSADRVQVCACPY